MRKYKSGSKWAFWCWTQVGYITRLFLIHTPWGGVMLHWFNRADLNPDMHDHPVDFFSLCLKGGYKEENLTGGYEHKPGRLRFIHHTHTHRVIEVIPGTLTLAFYSKKRQEWAFLVDGKRVDWREYDQVENG